jgi:hypothetical protein
MRWTLDHNPRRVIYFACNIDTRSKYPTKKANSKDKFKMRDCLVHQIGSSHGDEGLYFAGSSREGKLHTMENLNDALHEHGGEERDASEPDKVC